jgi:hypothetical protein
MKAADQDVFHGLCQLPPDCMHHFRFDRGMIRHQAPEQPAVGATKVENPGGLGTVVP